jgi:hypothetical protein
MKLSLRENITARFCCTIRSNYRKILLKTVCLLSLVFVITINKVQAQENINYALHANIIYRFTKYIDWPKDHKNGDFVIGVVGETPLFDELKNFIVNKTVGGQKIVVRRFSGSSGPFNCHILFVSEDASSSLKKIAASSANTSTLIVSESEGLARKGSCINFIIVNEHLKIEINKNNIEQRRLGIASELLQLGKIVN